MSQAAPDFAAEVVRDLYRDQRKRRSIAWLLWVLTGVFGGHQFYLGKTWWGLVYLFSAGGGLVLWLVDAARLNRLVAAYNQIEAQRRRDGLPPQALSFLPPAASLALEQRPRWSERRGGRGARVGGTVLLAVLGFAMGVVSGAAGVYEPPVIVAVLIVTTLLAARWPGVRGVPVLGELSRWNHRLRLYYHTTDPGPVWLLALRPLMGVFVAPWQRTARAEVRLYLQMGVAFALLFTAVNLVEMRQHSVWAALGLTIAELAQTVVYTYVFVAPIGAILITQQLLARRDRFIVLMSALTLICGALGLRLVGAI